jgi:LEA14-like dessication related protein
MDIKISFELIIAVIGAITGIISLAWHIQKDKPNLVLSKACFEWVNKTMKNVPKDKEIIKITMEVDNLSNHPTTVKDIWFGIGNRTIMEKFEYSFQPKTIKECSSELFSFVLELNKDEFKNYFDENGKIELSIEIFHTFGRIKKRSSKTDFQTGWRNFQCTK